MAGAGFAGNVKELASEEDPLMVIEALTLFEANCSTSEEEEEEVKERLDGEKSNLPVNEEDKEDQEEKSGGSLNRRKMRRDKGRRR